MVFFSFLDSDSSHIFFILFPFELEKKKASRPGAQAVAITGDDAETSDSDEESEESESDSEDDVFADDDAQGDQAASSDSNGSNSFAADPNRRRLSSRIPRPVALSTSVTAINRSHLYDSNFETIRRTASQSQLVNRRLCLR